MGHTATGVVGNQRGDDDVGRCLPYLEDMTQTAISTRTDRSRALTATRALSGVIAALVLVQGASAGSYLTGLGGALDLHRRVGTELVSLLAIVTIVTAAFGVRRLGWPLPVSIVGFLGIGMQIGMGFTDQLQIHLPLGIALFGTYLAMAILIKNPNQTMETS